MSSEKKISPKPDRLEQARIDKLEKIVALGHDPYGGRFDGRRTIGSVRPLCPAESGTPGEAVRIAGRILLRRKAGKLRFFDIADATGNMQLLCSRGDLAEAQWELMSQFDLGDLIGVDGLLWRTDSGEVSLKVTTLHMLCKALAQPPEKYHGAADVELLLRHRSLDLIYTPGVRDRMLTRTRILNSIRCTLAERDFVEVETPVLHAVAGGAAARPFVTHHNALDIGLFLRIALELHLKRLLVGGIERVYEIGRVFRNEGIDATHNPEFTMMEVYQAYGDYHSMMDLTEAIVCDAARTVKTQADASGVAADGTAVSLDEYDRLTLPWGDDTIDLTPPWPRRTYADLFREHVGCDLDDEAAVRHKANAEFQLNRNGGGPTQPKHDFETAHPDVIVSHLFEELVEPHLIGPVFVIDYPASLCPLTKRKRDNPAVAERFELFIQRMELANAYTELTDPRLQEELFRGQLAGQDEADSMAKMDREFIQALKIGMPPAGGLGIGIDRLVMLLTNSRSIRDVIFFPLLRPEL